VRRARYGRNFALWGLSFKTSPRRRRAEATVIFDGRNLYDPAIRSQGFEYFAIGRFALAHHSPVILERQPACLGDVAEVRGNGAHATTTARHSDHHLRRPAQHGRLEPGADGGGARAEGEGGQARCL